MIQCDIASCEMYKPEIYKMECTDWSMCMVGALNLVLSMCFERVRSVIVCLSWMRSVHSSSLCFGDGYEGMSVTATIVFVHCSANMPNVCCVDVGE